MRVNVLKRHKGRGSSAGLHGTEGLRHFTSKKDERLWGLSEIIAFQLLTLYVLFDGIWISMKTKCQNINEQGAKCKVGGGVGESCCIKRWHEYKLSFKMDFGVQIKKGKQKNDGNYVSSNRPQCEQRTNTGDPSHRLLITIWKTIGLSRTMSENTGCDLGEHKLKAALIVDIYFLRVVNHISSDPNVTGTRQQQLVLTNVKFHKM